MLNKILKCLFILICLIIIKFNISGLQYETDKINMVKKLFPYLKIGYKFKGLDRFINDAEFIGYYTDDDLSENEPGKLFSQAQYVLAPTILEENNTDHQFVLFVCSNEINCLNKINELNATILGRNQFGIIIAEIPK